MKVLAVVCQKGGTSKTTLAVNLAVEALNYGLEVALIDLDPQVSAANWKDLREEDAPAVAAVPVPHLQRTLDALKQEGAELVIIDTAGRTEAAAAAAAKAADLVLVPVQPTLLDLKTLAATRELVQRSGGKPMRVILSRVKAAGTRQEDSAQWIESQGLEVCPTSLGERVTYQDAYAQGLGVTEAEPHGKAASEIMEVYKYTSRLLALKGRRHEESARPAKRTA